MPVARFQLKPHERNVYLLARDLGMTVERLRAEMSSEEYEQWVALYSVEAEEQKRAIKRAQDGVNA